MRRSRTLIAALGAIVVVSMVSTAQVSVEGSLSTLHDDNIDNARQQVADRIISLEGNARYEFLLAGSPANVFYDGTFDYYSLETDRSAGIHSAGAEWSLKTNDSGFSTIEAGASGSLRSGRGDFSVFDYRILSATLGYKYETEETPDYRLFYTYRSVAFSSLSDFDYSENALDGSFTTQFPTRTTLILAGRVGVKEYDAPGADSLTTMSGMGRGKGGMSLLPTSAAFLGQASVRVGQAVFDETGISLFLRYQATLKTEARTLAGIGGMLTDNEIFDDPYGYGGLTWSASVTQVLPFDARIKVSMTEHEKNYGQLSAWDAAGNLVSRNRADTRTVYSFEMTQEISSLTVALSVVTINNASNDYDHQYSNTATNIVFTVPF